MNDNLFIGINKMEVLNFRGKRSQSEIISTVLLILLVIASIMLIAGFLVNFVKERLSDADCINVLQEVQLSNRPQYNCYDFTNQRMIFQVEFKDNESLSGFAVEVGGAATRTFEVRENSFPPEITMFSGGNLELPKKNTARAYNITGVTTKPDNIKIYPIMESGQLCDKSDELNSIELC